ALEGALDEAALAGGLAAVEILELGNEGERGHAVGLGEGQSALEARRRIADPLVLVDHAVAIDDALGRHDLEKDAVGGILLPVGPLHDVVPAAADAEVELADRVGKALRAPPAAEVERIGEHLPDQRARRVEA